MKKVIKKSDIYKSYYQTQNQIGNKTKFAKMIDWFEMNDYNITQSAYKRINKFLDTQSLILDLIK